MTETMPEITDRMEKDDLIVEVKNITSGEISGKILFPKTSHAPTPFNLKPGQRVEVKRNMKGWACPPYKVEYKGRGFSGTDENEGFK